MKIRWFGVILAVLIVLIVTASVIIVRTVSSRSGKIISGSFDTSRQKSDEEWRSILSSEQYSILRKKGTEKAFSGTLLKNKKAGIYLSAGCDQPLFRSEEKYDANTGWMSFARPITDDGLVLREDNTIFAKKIEVLDKCGSHLGYIEDDDKSSTKKRYTINSAALKFIEDTYEATPSPTLNP